MSAHLFVVMGSGETTPTMVTPHQQVFARLPDAPEAVLLDTPYGFQENADELSARTQDYFATNVGTPVDVVSLRSVDDPQAPEVERAQATIADADWVFLGPGSPTYLLEQLAPTQVPRLLRERLTDGPGATVVSSAAAVTVGSHAVPVYEIYKAGHAPHWREGLGLLQQLGLDAVLIPHFDNAEGGTHDTRYCYLGERRLRAMEAELPDGTWVLGVDEHTALEVDLADGSVVVKGRGGVTVRRSDRSTEVVPAGERTTIADLAAAARRTGAAAAAPPPASPDHDAASDEAPAAHEALLDEVTAHEEAFVAAAEAGDADAATGAVLELDRTIRAWAADSLTGDQRDRAVATLRGLVTRLGEFARDGLVDTREVIGPFVDLLLEERRLAREAGDYAAADRIRDRLVELGIEVRDRAGGTAWQREDDA